MNPKQFGNVASQVDRWGKELKENSAQKNLVELKNDWQCILLTSEVRPHFDQIQKNVATPSNDREREAIEILELYKEQYDLVVHGNLETPSYDLERYLIDGPKEQEILLGLAMMDLYSSGKSLQESEARKAREFCSAIHFIIVNSKGDDNLETLEKEFL